MTDDIDLLHQMVISLTAKVNMRAQMVGRTASFGDKSAVELIHAIGKFAQSKPAEEWWAFSREFTRIGDII